MIYIMNIIMANEQLLTFLITTLAIDIIILIDLTAINIFMLSKGKYSGRQDKYKRRK